MMMDIRAIARALGGEVVGRDSIVCPGPGHGPQDRSLSVRLSASSPEGFLTHSFAGDDWRDCREHVRRLLGIKQDREWAPHCAAEGRRQAMEPRPQHDDGRAHALALWHAAGDPRGTLVECYLAYRRLSLDDGIASHALRWHPGVGAMIALFRNIRNGEPQAVSRTFLDGEGRKIERKFLGPVGGAAIKLDADEEVLGGLHVGEGVETCMAARQIGLRPAWALGSAGAIAAFPVLPAIECMTILREKDAANERAAETCAARWCAAGREVLDAWPNAGKDANDAIRGGA